MNDVPLHYLKPNGLVKFRCFIQDMFDPEFYMGVYETVDPATKEKVSIAAICMITMVPFSYSHGLPQVLRCGKYKDVTECGVSVKNHTLIMKFLN